MTRTARWTAACLLAAALLFVLYPATRPWADETTAAGAVEAMGSPWWLASHAFAMVGFILVALGLLGLRDLLAGAGGHGSAGAAVILGWLGTGLTLPYYGAETFGLFVMARAGVTDPVGFSEDLRFAPLPMTMFALGLLALAAAAVLAAWAVARSGTLPRAGGMVMAAGFVLFLPQFFTPPVARIAHGALLGLGLAWLALTLVRAARRKDVASPPHADTHVPLG